MTDTTDYYTQCQDALGALFLSATDIFVHDWQVSDDDTNVNKGADVFITFTPGQFQEVPRSNDQSNINEGWEILFELRVRFTQIGKSKEKFRAIRSVLFNLVKDHKRLDYPTKQAIGVLGTTLMATKQMQYWYDKQGQPSPTWIVQYFKATVLQVVPIGR